MKAEAGAFRSAAQCGGQGLGGQGRRDRLLGEARGRRSGPPEGGWAWPVARRGPTDLRQPGLPAVLCGDREGRNGRTDSGAAARLLGAWTVRGRGVQALEGSAVPDSHGVTQRPSAPVLRLLVPMFVALCLPL